MVEEELIDKLLAVERISDSLNDVISAYVPR